MTQPGITVSGATTAITRRTNMRKAFLAPWHPLVRNIWLYSIATAQHETDVAVHLGSLVVTHHHIDVTPSEPNLPRFTWRVHHDMSCALNALLSREKYDSPRELWDGRRSHYLRLMDEAAQASHLVYEHINCVAAGLVDRPEHMPDFVFDFGLWKTGFIDVERPPVFFGKNRPESLRLKVTPPPLLFRAFGGDMERLVYHMEKLSEQAMQSVRRARKRPVAGAKKVSRIHPWSEPSTLRESGGTKRPTFRIGARGIVAIETEIECAREVRAFANATARPSKRGAAATSNPSTRSAPTRCARSIAPRPKPCRRSRQSSHARDRCSPTSTPSSSASRFRGRKRSRALPHSRTAFEKPSLRKPPRSNSTTPSRSSTKYQFGTRPARVKGTATRKAE